MNDANHYGKQQWAFAAGCIPLKSTGWEPAFTSHDKIAILNVSKRDATVNIEVFYEGPEPVAFGEIVVRSRRVRKVRFNDLIDPFPVPLDLPFGFILRSDVPVVVQFTRMNTSEKELAAFCVTPYSQMS